MLYSDPFLEYTLSLYISFTGLEANVLKCIAKSKIVCFIQSLSKWKLAASMHKQAAKHDVSMQRACCTHAAEHDVSMQWTCCKHAVSIKQTYSTSVVRGWGGGMLAMCPCKHVSNSLFFKIDQLLLYKPYQLDIFLLLFFFLFIFSWWRWHHLH